MARGRRSKSIEGRIEVLEGLTIDGALRILNGNDEARKFTLIKELAGKVLARRVKVAGGIDLNLTPEVENKIRERLSSAMLNASRN